MKLIEVDFAVYVESKIVRRADFLKDLAVYVVRHDHRFAFVGDMNYLALGWNLNIHVFSGSQV